MKADFRVFDLMSVSGAHRMRVVLLFCLPVFSVWFLSLLVYCTSNRDVGPLCAPSVGSVFWYGSWVPTRHRCSGESTVLGWWQPYSWRNCTSMSRVSATWWWGNLWGVLTLTLPPLTATCPLSIRKAESGSAEGGKLPDISVSPPSPLHGGPS